MFKYIIILITIISLAGCTKKDDLKNQTQASGNYTWLFDNEYLRLAPGNMDHIKSIDYPQFETTYGVNLGNHDIVYIYRYEDIVRIYPQNVLARHEIVNDMIRDHHFCITYCPLTGTAVAWNREINGTITEFGVSGHLYHNNLIAYDRNSNQNWSQMYTLNINGINSGDRLEHKSLIRSDWIMARNSFAGAQVLLADSSYVCNDTICNVPADTRNIEDQLIYGVIAQGIDYESDQAKLFETPKDQEFTNIVSYSLGNKSGFVIQNVQHGVMAAFFYSYAGQRILVDETNVPITFTDEKGNKYDITGYIFSGPDKGSRLVSPLSYGAKMFAWEGFYGL